MNRVKISFCLFLFCLSFIYVASNLKKINLFNFFVSDNKGFYVLDSTLGSSFSDSINEEKKQKEDYDLEIVNQEITDLSGDKPIVYFYNTHQTEEYKSNVYNIVPTVVTMSEMLRENLLDKGIVSLVEEGSIKKGLDKYNYDYSGSYSISMMYLEEKKKKYPSIEYYFDIHRDSVKGEYSRTSIGGKSYAKIMFLVGKNHENYKKNVSNIKKMEEYLNKYYKGILRDTYYQPLYSYNQEYDSNMFLVEVGGVDNTLEELYNTSVALAGAINYYVRGDYEK